MIEVKTSTGGLEQLIARLKTYDRAALEKQISDILLEEIKKDTREHRDVRGNAFKPYTDGYKKTRIKKGLSTEPDLRVTGTLLDSLVAAKSGIITTISDTDNEGKVEGVNALRNFIGISKRSRERIIETVKSFVGNIIK